MKAGFFSQNNTISMKDARLRDRQAMITRKSNFRVRKWCYEEGQKEG